jgi:hypothetical protein
MELGELLGLDLNALWGLVGPRKGPGSAKKMGASSLWFSAKQAWRLRVRKCSCASRLNAAGQQHHFPQQRLY